MVYHNVLYITCDEGAKEAPLIRFHRGQFQHENAGAPLKCLTIAISRPQYRSQVLTDRLSKNATLSTLNLSSNALGNEGAPHLAQVRPMCQPRYREATILADE